MCLFLAAEAQAGLWSKPNPPQPGTVVEAPPSKHVTLTVGGILYYYSRGSYYTRSGQQYVVTLPPIGAEVRKIPGYYMKEHINDSVYYTYQNIYYLRTSEGFRVVAKPLGAKP